MPGEVYKNRVDFMDMMAEDDSVVFINYTKKYRGNATKSIFLLEGIDDINYYERVFDKYYGEFEEDWVYLVCHGRSNVISLVKELEAHTKDEYKNSLYYGFIDKDYYEKENNPSPDRIYITPVYSIENFYVSEAFFKNVIKRKFHLEEGDPINSDFNKCLDHFKEMRADFIHGIKELDCFLRCNRIMFEEKSITSKINARDISLEKHVNIDIGGVKFKTRALDVLNKKIEDFDHQALQLANDFYKGRSDEELSFLVRGKFMFFFIVNYLFRLKEDNRKAKPTLFHDSYENSQRKHPHKVKFTKTVMSIGKDSPDFLSDFSKFSDIPKCLTEFIVRIKTESATGFHL